MVKEEYVEDLIYRFNLAKKLRSENHEENWNTLSRHAMPYLPVSFNSNDQEKLSQESFTEETFDPTFAECCRKSASIMETLLTPHYRIWHKLRGISKRQLEKEESVFKDLGEKNLEELLERINKTLFRYRYSASSSFEVAMADIYHSLMVYGNACMAVFEHTDDEDKVDGFSYKCMPLQEMYWEENFERKVDTVFHRFTLKPRQIASSDQWSIDELSDSTQEAIANGKDEDISFLHIVYPKEKIIGHSNMKKKNWTKKTRIMVSRVFF